MKDFQGEVSRGDPGALNIAVSPSGNFYGSEQTLMTYLEHTKLVFLLFVPSNSCEELTQRAKALPNVSLHAFHSPVDLSVKISWLILKCWTKKMNINVYLNEAGLIRYINRLPRLGKLHKVVHVRLTEDVTLRPWHEVNKNGMTVLSTSSFVANELKKIGVESEVLSSPFRSLGMVPAHAGFFDRRLIVVSRLSHGKGLKWYKSFFEFLESQRMSIRIDHYGRVDESEEEFLEFVHSLKFVKWNSRGFESDKTAIFNEGTLLHLNPVEPLGVVLMEAINHGVPYLAFDNGGTGEISKNLGLDDFSVDCAAINWEETMLAKWQGFANADETRDRLSKAKRILEKSYSPDEYSRVLDKRLMRTT